ncbi:hypothetical protein GOODEAATRI_016330 [Goodea atripinnis]|uniref:Uncharacterized protein n=1 Tax=Goodea atripinnis TaxID=208336 RepID=A0ABV0PP21_9TELE
MLGLHRRGPTPALEMDRDMLSAFRVFYLPKVERLVLEAMEKGVGQEMWRQLQRQSPQTRWSCAPSWACCSWPACFPSRRVCGQPVGHGERTRDLPCTCQDRRSPWTNLWCPSEGRGCALHDLRFMPCAPLISYVPKKGRNVLLLSTLHTGGVDVAHEHQDKKPWEFSLFISWNCTGLSQP